MTGRADNIPDGASISRIIVCNEKDRAVLGDADGVGALHVVMPIIDDDFFRPPRAGRNRKHAAENIGMARRDIALDKGVNLVVLGIPSGSVPASFVSIQLSRRFPGRTVPEEHLNIVSLGLIDDRDFGGDVFRMEKDSVGARLLAGCINQSALWAGVSIRLR